jgi:uncharacterized protein YegJ (DUF2314 family)
MRSRLLAILFLAVISCAHGRVKSDATAPANPPPDQPVTVRSDPQLQKLMSAIEPYVKKARATYPEAKARFQAGLPSGSTFFATVQLHDAEGKMEQVFVQVDQIEAGWISGFIQNDIKRMKGFAKGQRYTFPESEIIDWTISNRDGTEEGNVVGKFLDTWHGEVP